MTSLLSAPAITPPEPSSPVFAPVIRPGRDPAPHARDLTLSPPHTADPAPSPPPGRHAGLPPPHLARIAPLLAAEAAAEAPAASGLDPADLEQAVWLRLLEGPAPPHGPDAGWLRAAVRAEARAARRRARHEVAHDPGALAGSASTEADALHALRGRALRAAVDRLPGRCPQLLGALMSGSDPTYREISRELGISQGSLGPLRSRCLGCLRTVLRSEG